jgi:hypothetical protein
MIANGEFCNLRLGQWLRKIIRFGDAAGNSLCHKSDHFEPENMLRSKAFDIAL